MTSRRFRPTAHTFGLPLLAVSLSLAACAPADEGDAAKKTTTTSEARGAYKREPGKPGGTISYATFGEPKTFNRALAAETSSTDILNRCFVALTGMDGITTADTPELAEKWEMQPDKVTYLYHLRKGLKWSDGQPLTADDVVFSYKEIAMNYPEIPSNLHDSLLIDGKNITVEKVDDLTIRFKMPKPVGPATLVIGSVPIFPKHVFANTIHEKDASGKIKFNTMWGVDTDVTKIVCNGPFMIGEYVPGQRTVLIRNPNYWRKDAQGVQEPYIEKYVWYSVKDFAAMLLKFKAKEVDLNEPMRPADYEVMKPLEKDGNFTITEGGVDARSDFLIMNMTTGKSKEGKPFADPIKSKWFRNLHFRKAMQYAIDRPTMVKSVYRGLASPCYSATIAHGSPFYTDDFDHYDYDLKKAEAELTAGGYKKDAKGQLQDAEGHPVAFTLQTNTGNTNRDAQCNIMRTDWAKLGMQVDYKPIEFNVMVGRIDETHDFDVILMGLSHVESPDPHLGINTWLLSGKMHMMNLGAGTTYEPWEQEILALYEKGAVTTDKAERIKVYQEAAKLEAKYLPFVYTVSQNYLVGTRNTIGNIYPTAIGRSWWNIHEQFVRSAT